MTIQLGVHAAAALKRFKVANIPDYGADVEVALADALAKGRLGGAGLDIFQQEPPSQDNPLLSLENTVVSDHAAWY